MNFNFLQSNVYFPVLVGLCAIFLSYYLFKLYGKKKGGSNQQEKIPKVSSDIQYPKEGILCRIADNITGRIYNARITPEQAKDILKEHKTLGRQWDREGIKVYGLNKYENDKGIISFRPIQTPSAIDTAPSELHNDIKQPWIGMIMSELLKEDKSFAQKYGQVLWWIAVMGFLLFMWSQAK